VRTDTSRGRRLLGVLGGGRRQQTERTRQMDAVVAGMSIERRRVSPGDIGWQQK